MPRQFPFVTVTMATITPKANLGAAAAAFLLLCAFTLMGCASHSGRWRRWMASRRRSYDPVISIHQVQPGTDGGGEIGIWQKGVLMGEKCQLPDFSGVITYDSVGNLIAPGRPRLTNSFKG